MKLYPFLSCLPVFLLPTLSNPLPAIDDNAQLDFTELISPSFAGPGHFDSQLPQNEGTTIQADRNSDLNPLLFSIASENPDRQIEHFSQTSTTKSVCDDRLESGHGFKHINKYRLRRDETMCAVKEEDIDWDKMWSTFSKIRAQVNGDAPACPNPAYPLHICCRGPRSHYVYNRNIIRMVKNCAPCKLPSTLFLPCCHSRDC